VAKALADLGVGTAVHYPTSVPAQPMYGPLDERAWPESASAAREVLSLPGFAELTDEEVEEVARAVRLACERL
jgi:dTDP-4-amino-4,6-dideoxygalactose transaminase